MDPTPTVSCVFSMRGNRTMNHQAAHAWKELINKESGVSKQWKQKYSRATLEDETKLLLESFKRDREAKLAQAPEKRTDTRKLLYDGISKEGSGRAAYLKAQNALPPKEKSYFPRTSAQEVGWRTERENTNFEKTEYGRKPVIESSFFRKRGVFGAPAGAGLFAAASNDRST
eukprot:NODE_1628_length_818_cov_298.994798_g1266_i0.p1 GENE.NODE_1628_length_818_cov_298.994798_g1266_i0~~NODE_1628_length_818_cov_298.994798_g1266_i0.p1  ORF type:complete len:190 (+),score=49.21 NODE_1628_length_818_cov_298.994798_g1266_i0:56-571(+)